MRTSTTPSALISARGFSLIEIMVVLVIIGIAAATVSLSIAPDPARVLRQDAQELAQRLGVAQEEVRIDGRAIVWQVQGDGYRFVRGTWQIPAGHVVPRVTTQGDLEAFEQDDLLRPHQWRSEQVQVEPGGPLLLTNEWIGSPWELVLRSGGAKVTLARDATGGFQVH